MKLLTLRMIGTVLLSLYFALAAGQGHAAIAANAAVASNNNAALAAETKKVCHEEKGKQVCKEIKVHKKLDGTKVPPK